MPFSNVGITVRWGNVARSSAFTAIPRDVIQKCREHEKAVKVAYICRFVFALHWYLLTYVHTFPVKFLLAYFMAIQGGAIKTGPPSHCKYSEIPWPNCVEMAQWVNFCNYYMLNTVINFLFKNFIALWRHLAKKTATVVYSHCTNRYEHHTVPVFSLARWNF